MPGSCFSYMDSYGQSVRKDIYLKIEEYCNGMVTDEQLREFFIDTCKDMRVYHTQSRHTSGKNPEDNSQIIRQVYEIFQKVNVESMVDMCFQEGKCISSGWGGDEKSDWVYYDSKYNDKSMHLRQLLQETATSVAEDWDLDPIDYGMVESQSKYTVNGGHNEKEI